MELTMTERHQVHWMIGKSGTSTNLGAQEQAFSDTRLQGVLMQEFLT